jgi:hypothetical protein
MWMSATPLMRPMVTNYCRRGLERLFGDDQRVEAEAADAWRAANVVRERSGNPKREDPPAAQTAKPGESGGPIPGTLAYEQWRLTREKADRERIDREALLGTLLKRDEVRGAVSGMIAAAKSRLITLPDELCDRVAAESDSVRCREMMAAKVHEALSQLAEYPACA